MGPPAKLAEMRISASGEDRDSPMCAASRSRTRQSSNAVRFASKAERSSTRSRCYSIIEWPPSREDGGWRG